jgi:GNAT superfamily N-acetyltransferase
VIVRPMSHADILEGLRLCRASNWNQLGDDWRFFLDLGGASLAIADDGAVVGSVAWLPFGDFAWLSMMLVDPAVRRGGIGSRLMVAALTALKDQSVRLDATPAGEPMYRKFGFVDEYPLARATAAGGRPSDNVRPMRPFDLPGIFARDRAVFGGDRSALLADLYRRAPDLAWVGSTGAWCFGRPGFLFPQIGPIVAPDCYAAREVVDHCLAAHPGREFVVDVVQRPDGLDFPVLRPFLRMCLGESRTFGEPGQVFAIAGPEFG